MSNATAWQARLAGKIEPDLAKEIDTFETQITLRKAGKIEETVFAETRLRRGSYGQRYDNGHRHDGKELKKLTFPNTGITTKGPNTEWDAPGMLRIKFPYGGLTAAQLETLAELAEEYSDQIAHITTRQDFQLHFIHIEDTPDIMRRLAAVGITTREACGNSVRNVTACPLAGVCRTESFDVTPYSRAFFRFMLGHPDAQDFGRKFKMAFSGCEHEACGLINMHDMGALAVVKDGARGFRLYVGGGLGPTPFNAQVLEDFVPVDQLLPYGQAVSRVYGRLGEKKLRSMARIKFLVKKLGIGEFQRLVREELKVLTVDPRWKEWPAEEVKAWKEEAKKPAQALNGAAKPAGFASWQRDSVYQQRQAGYVVVYIMTPLGDYTPDQMRGLADIVRKYTNDTCRTTVDQNVVLRYVSEADLPAIFADLGKLGLAKPGANTIADITACPGTDTCKLGISSSRGMARELQRRLLAAVDDLPEDVRKLKIKVSGCPNSCSQHHIADLGFYGGSRKVGGYTVPHFNVVLGGQWTENAGSYGLAICAVPSKRIPDVVDRITGKFAAEHTKGESFQAYIKRIGKGTVLELLKDLTVLPTHDAEPRLYSDWGDPREFTMSDIGKGECAGEVITPSQFALEASGREIFEAQITLDKGDLRKALDQADASMHHGALAALRVVNREFPDQPAKVYEEFNRLFCSPDPMSGKLFEHLPAGHKPFARLLRKAHDQPVTTPTADAVHVRVEEAQLWLEAMHSFMGNVAAAAGLKVDLL